MKTSQSSNSKNNSQGKGIIDVVISVITQVVNYIAAEIFRKEEIYT
jgi:hypothetical protein